MNLRTYSENSGVVRWTRPTFDLLQNKDLNLLPSQSMIRIYGRLTTADGKETKNTSLVNFAIFYLFENIRYELNAVEIDRCKNVGVTTAMKG